MVEKKRKKPDSHGDLANHKQESTAELAKPHKLNRSALSSHQIYKGKSAMAPSNSTTEHTDIVDQIKENPFNQVISLSYLQSALSPCHFCKGTGFIAGKSAMEPLVNITEDMYTANQAIGIFHEEIIMEILSRLPVRSLHRFKCISKFWMALISDPFFKKKHLSRAKNDKKFQKLLAAKVSRDKSNMVFCCFSLLSVPLVEDEEKLDFPSNWRPGHFHYMLCSCDGLVLLSVFRRNDDGFDEYLLLWNPSTRESRLLPHPGLKLSDCLFGLGYDTSSNDYKILAVDLHKVTSFIPIQCKILALKRGSWRYCNYPTHISRILGVVGAGMDSMAFIHGAFHWVGRRFYSKPIIVTFDISMRFLERYPCPTFPYGMHHMIVAFQCWEERFAVMLQPLFIGQSTLVSCRSGK